MTATSFALALDLGGTKIEAALVDSAARVVAGSRTRRPTGRDLTPPQLTAVLADVTAAALAALPPGAVPAGIGVGSAGPIDHVRGTISPVNLAGVQGFALASAAAGAARDAGYELPVMLGHDGGCLALAEAWMGATRGAAASLSIVVSTGIGGGFVWDGALFRGASGNAGHLGQTHVADGDLTLEEVASGPASVAWANVQGWTGVTGEDLARDAAAGDATARAAVERSAEAVGYALADASTLLDLDIIAIGGGFSRVSPDYIELVQAALQRHAALPYSRATRVVPSGLGDEGPLIGAAALVVGPGGQR